MAITVYSTGSDSIELKEFLEFLDRNFDYLNLDALVQIAPMFAKLGRNPRFIEHLIIQELKDIANFQKENPYSSQSLNLGMVSNKYFIRANIWLPLSELNKNNEEGESRLYSYNLAHDHNFDFLTIGYLGRGYETDIYEYDAKELKGAVGEKVNLRYLESTSLTEQKMMIYRASRDVHVQKFPKELSVSLNVLVPPARDARDQLSFDLNSMTVSGIIRSNFLGQRSIIEAASKLCGDNVADILVSIARNHYSKRTREAAKKAILERGYI